MIDTIAPLADDEPRSMTILNELGDVEVSWDSQNDDAMRSVIDKKMKEGVRFFVLSPLLGGLLFRKKAMKNMADLREQRVKIGDGDLENLFDAGKIAVFRSDGRELTTVGVAKTTDQVVRQRTVGIRPLQGG